ncbi:GNAT family N-acetyltransferase [Variovorax sp. LT1P1]|uniref:GNAT family N-acetyltransferase n=1 Tax=Variovorax sp. LT1P1 TaxID=3443730 RepID=UPI003F447D08
MPASIDRAIAATRPSKPRLATFRDEPVQIAGSSGDLAMFLLPVNDPAIAARIGAERILGRRAKDLLRTEGELFSSPAGRSVKGGRYLLLDGETIVAALNVTTIGRQGTVASNLYVAPTHRRKGLATRLIDCAKLDFPGLTADTSLTFEGAAFLGYRPAPEMEIGTVQDTASDSALQLFHGTNSAIDAFDMNLSGRNFACSAGAMFFTDELAVAEQIADFVAENEGGVPHIVTATVAMKNPLVRDFFGGAIDIRTLVEEAKTLGHDGIVAMNALDGMPAWPANQFIAFDPGQIAIVSTEPSAGSGLTAVDAHRAAGAKRAKEWVATRGAKAAPRA